MPTRVRMAYVVIGGPVTLRHRHFPASILSTFPRTHMPRFPMRGPARRSSVIAAAMALAGPVATAYSTLP